MKQMEEWNRHDEQIARRDMYIYTVSPTNPHLPFGCCFDTSSRANFRIPHARLARRSHRDTYAGIARIAEKSGT